MIGTIIALTAAAAGIVYLHMIFSERRRKGRLEKVIIRERKEILVAKLINGECIQNDIFFLKNRFPDASFHIVNYYENVYCKLIIKAESLYSLNGMSSETLFEENKEQIEYIKQKAKDKFISFLS
ncbi:hypothetical protein CWC03_16345 [Pseudoalteromonas sp. S2755]|nr:hypothetical protein CWC03_16345 [Pseudoalteromonas sp. S2755]